MEIWSFHDKLDGGLLFNLPITWFYNNTVKNIFANLYCACFHRTLTTLQCKFYAYIIRFWRKLVCLANLYTKCYACKHLSFLIVFQFFEKKNHTMNVNPKNIEFSNLFSSVHVRWIDKEFLANMLYSNQMVPFCFSLWTYIRALYILYIFAWSVFYGRKNR